MILSQSCLHPYIGCGCLRLAVGSGLLVRFLAVGCGLNKSPGGWIGVAGALPRRWLRVKQVAWRWDRGLLVRFLAVGCGLNKAPDGG